MSHQASSIPQVMPILSAGRHRTPRQGACFMEFASYLAGDKWSDHPPCTHPLLAALARDVNDLTTDAARAKLLPLVHRVVGLNGDDPSLASAIIVRAAAAALPVASMERQRALAVGLLARLPQIDSVELRATAEEALASVPGATEWAAQYLGSYPSPRHVRRGADEAMVHTATVGITFACYGPDETSSEARLEQLLTGAIEDVESFLGAAAQSPRTQLVPTG
ncbi:hypothetical protein BH10ACT7_BH10ACT7_19490 [soil metagenome]